MTESRTPIFRAATEAYRDAARVFGAMRMLVLCAMLVALAVSVAEDMVPQSIWKTEITASLLAFVLGVAKSFCLTPILIAIHRFIILDEVTQGYRLDLEDPAFLPFFGWLVALSILGSLIFWVQAALTTIGLPLLVVLAVTLAVLLAVLVVWIRLTVLFPALAVRAQGANFESAMADSKGRFFYIFAIFLLALLPMTGLAIGVTLLLGRGANVTGSPTAVIGLVAGAIIQTAITVLSVCIASRLFQSLAKRLAQKA
jgi:hypothetical protein